MNRKEIIKEAQEQVNYCTPLYPESFIQGYIAGAEPRENKIADIKANCDLAIEGRDIKIKELEHQLTHRNCLDCSNHSSNLRMRTLELEKENAELKKKIGIYQKGMYDEIEKRDKKLTKAKEIIKDLLRLPYANDWEVYGDVTSYLDKAEQFLKEIEK